MRKRHTCVICGKKRYEDRMKKVFIQSWACISSCYGHNDVIIGEKMLSLEKELKVLKRNKIWGR